MIGWLVACHSPPAPVERPPVVLEPGVPWRTRERPVFGAELPSMTPSEAALDPEALKRFGDYAFSKLDSDPERQGQRTNAVVILRHGHVVYERYDRGTTKDTPLLTWSVTKSFGATVLGAAVHNGWVDIQQPLCGSYTPMCTDGRDQVRWADALQMSSGLDWQETYETSPVFSSVMAMLYTRGARDMAAYAAEQAQTAPAGTRWVYSSGDSNIISAAMKKPLGSAYETYPFTSIIEPIGMKNARYERDASGTFVASSYLYASGRDVARWGQLMLDDGMWNGKRILAPGWVRFSRTMAPAFYTTDVGVEHHMSNPGAQWYVNLGDADRGLEPPWPALPPLAFGASGHWGKYLWVIPEWDMVVVRMGDDRRYGCSYDVQPKCIADVEAAFTKTLWLERLAAAVLPEQEEPPLAIPMEVP